MRRVFIIPVLVLLQVAAFGIAGTPAAASGCGNNGTWQQIDYHAAPFTDPLGQNWSADITTWHDGCGNKQAKVTMWSSTGSYLDNGSGGSPVLVMRQWTCGTQDFGTQTFVAHNGGVLWSGWWPSNGCGDQWDDAFVASWSTLGATSAALHDAGRAWPTKPYLSVPCNQYNC